MFIIISSSYGSSISSSSIIISIIMSLISSAFMSLCFYCHQHFQFHFKLYHILTSISSHQNNFKWNIFSGFGITTGCGQRPTYWSLRGVWLTATVVIVPGTSKILVLSKTAFCIKRNMLLVKRCNIWAILSALEKLGRLSTKLHIKQVDSNIS